MEKEYKIAVDYRICGTVKVKAKSLKEALSRAEYYGMEDVKDKEYIDGSWMVNKEMSEFFLENEIEGNEETGA